MKNSYTPTTERFERMAASPEFNQLRNTFLRFAIPITVAFLAWFFFFIISATFAPTMMATPVYKAVNLGMVLGLAQFATTGLVTFAYVRFADNKFDPMAAPIRAAMEQPNLAPTPVKLPAE